MTQDEYNKHDTLLQEQCIYMSDNSSNFNDEIYEREWEWIPGFAQIPCRVACSANRSLAPAFHDFIKEVENES